MLGDIIIVSITGALEELTEGDRLSDIVAFEVPIGISSRDVG